MLIAHILPNNVVPDTAQWAAISVTAVGGVGIVRRRRRALDLAAWMTFTVGTTAILVMVGIGLFAPQPPGYALSLSGQPGGASPLEITVCARYPGGSYTQPPQNGDVLTALIDGRQAGYFLTNQFAIPVAPGRHLLQVELLNRDHREFNPRVSTSAAVTVSSSGPPHAPPLCPSA